MSEQQRELVFCHACENEWHRDEHGLECPQCHSDVVEIIDEQHDPRDNHITISDDDDDDDDASTTQNRGNDSLPQHPLHNHNPWQADHPDPAEPDIEHVEWRPSPGIQVSHTSFRSSGGSPNEIMPPQIFQNFSMIFNGRQASGQQQGRISPFPQHGPDFVPPGFGPIHHHRHRADHHQIGGPRGPPGPGGGRNAFTATVGQNPFPGNRDGNNIAAVFATLLQSVQNDMMEQQGHGRNRPDNAAPAPGAEIHAFISSILGNGRHGDAVYSDEALDRIITQMMDSTNPNSAPGPATAAAIAALPKKKVDKSMMGSDGKAECSVCMDAVEIGDEVTMLPCKHWFHEDCVGAWLKEHDTCPHCRQGIMPKDVPEDTNTPRSPDQAPRNIQNPFPLNRHIPPMPPTNGIGGPPPPPMPGNFPNPGFHQGGPVMPGTFAQPGLQHPYVPGGYQQYPEPRNFIVPQGAGPSQPGHYSYPPSPHANSPHLQHQQQQHYPFPPPSPHHQQEYGRHRRRSSVASSRAEQQRSGSRGEGSSSGGGVTGWFRNLRGGTGSDHR